MDAINYKVEFFEKTPGMYTFIPKYAGIYKIECWGAAGGTRNESLAPRAKGGYASGEVTLITGEKMYVYVGGDGQRGDSKRGYNGGGSSGYPGICGGGASDVRYENSLYGRIIVAGGGGSCGASNKRGGAGGGEAGITRTESYGSGGAGGTQTAGGTYRGSFGVGGNGIAQNSGYGGGGGGGWYGGGGVNPDGSSDDDRGGGGGSGYVLTASSHKPDSYNPPERFYMNNAVLIDGVTGMPSPDGGTSVGNPYLDGVVKITCIKNLIDIQHYVVESEGNLYILKDEYYDRDKREYIPIDESILKTPYESFKKYQIKRSYMFKRVYYPDESFIPLEKFKNKKPRILKFDIIEREYTGAFDELGNEMFEEHESDAIFPTKIVINKDPEQERILSTLIRVTGFKGDIYNLNFIDINTDSMVKVLIDESGTYYGKDGVRVGIEDIMTKGMSYSDLKDFPLYLEKFDLIIGFPCKYDEGEELRAIKHFTKTLNDLNRIHEPVVLHDIKKDKVYVKVDEDYKNLIINKMNTKNSDYEKPMKEF